MSPLDPALQYAAAGVALLSLIAFLLFQPNNFVRWLQKKNYQYEVTFSLYMLTPTEKFIFNSVLFLTFSMFATACCVYLPSHIVIMSRRAYYYFAGDAATAASHFGGTASKASEAVYDAATNLVGAAFRALNTSAAVEEVASEAVENLGS